MTEEKLERLMQKFGGFTDSEGNEVKAMLIGAPVVLRGPVGGYDLVDKIERYYPGTLSILENKPKEADAYCELRRWTSEWTADQCVPCIEVQYCIKLI